MQPDPPIHHLKITNYDNVYELIRRIKRELNATTISTGFFHQENIRGRYPERIKNAEYLILTINIHDSSYHNVCMGGLKSLVAGEYEDSSGTLGRKKVILLWDDSKSSSSSTNYDYPIDQAFMARTQPFKLLN
jgi:hypothetical protein